MNDGELEELATLARLKLPEEAREQTVAQVESLLAYFAMLQGVNTEGVEPSAYPIDIPHRQRADRAEEPLTTDEVLANAPAKRGGCFLVPRVVEG